MDDSLVSANNFVGFVHMLLCVAVFNIIDTPAAFPVFLLILDDLFTKVESIPRSEAWTRRM